MSAVIRVPLVSTNEDHVAFVAWRRAPGTFVNRGDPICTVESTKANIEVEAESSGYLACLATPGSKVRVGDPLGAITDGQGEDVSGLLRPASSGAAPPADARPWTKKAALVAARLGVDVESLARRLGRTVSEADVRAAAAEGPSTGDLLDDRHVASRPERVLLLGGAAGAGAIALDALSRQTRQRAVAILDNNPATHGRTVMGVPVVGPTDQAEQMWRDGRCDSVIIAFVGASIAERMTLFERLSAIGIPFTNVIDPSADIRRYATVGRGNLIMAHSFIAACASIGDNNFLASHSSVEHHSRIGSHCSFGPRTTITGAVTIGDRVKFGAGVIVEPYLTIGDDALVASGCVITADVAPATVLKARVGHVAQPREDR